MRLVLASASPRRADLLRAAGFSFDVWPVEIDEARLAGETPDDYVRRLSHEKALRAQQSLGGQPGTFVVVGADTTVVLDGETLGKPRDDREAADMLRRLAGRRHEVLTGMSLRSEELERHRVERTSVFMTPLSEDDVRWYVAGGEGRDKAGAYAIQGAASRFIWRVEGSYSNVVGLPVSALHELLGQMGCRLKPDVASAR
jgi:septum formation protein